MEIRSPILILNSCDWNSAGDSWEQRLLPLWLFSASHLIERPQVIKFDHLGIDPSSKDEPLRIEGAHWFPLKVHEALSAEHKAEDSGTLVGHSHINGHRTERRLTWQFGDRKSHSRLVLSNEPEINVSSTGDIEREVTLHPERQKTVSCQAGEESCDWSIFHHSVEKHLHF